MTYDLLHKSNYDLDAIEKYIDTQKKKNTLDLY